MIRTVVVLKKFYISFNGISFLFHRCSATVFYPFWNEITQLLKKLFVCLSKKITTNGLLFTANYNKNKFCMVKYSKSCPQNVVHLQWLYPPSSNYNQNPLTDISIKHCQGFKMKKQQTLILTADIISTNIRIIKNLK